VRQPRATGPRTVVGPHAPGIHRRGHPGHRGGQPGLLAMQLDNRPGQLGVSQHVRVELEQALDGGGQWGCDFLGRLPLY